MIRRYGFRTGRAARRRTGATAGSGPGEPSFAAVIATLFASGAPGAAWSFADATGLWQDTAGSLPVTAPEQPLARVNDLSGHGLHLAQPSAALRPLWTTLPNGRPAALFDGVDDFLSLAALDLTATDKVTVIAGARKMSDAGLGCIAETSTNAPANAGALYLFGPHNAGVPNYGLRIRGTSTATPALLPSGPVPAPHSAVLTVLGDLAAPAAEFRINGISDATSSSPTGGGPFRNWPLFVGRRAGSSAAFIGYLTALIIIGRLLAPEEIALAETAVNAQIGAY